MATGGSLEEIELEDFKETEPNDLEIEMENENAETIINVESIRRASFRERIRGRDSISHRVECEFAGTATQFNCCAHIGLKIRIFVICGWELILISYLLTTSILIYITPDNHYRIWYTQPFLALVWLKHPSLLFWFFMIMIVPSVLSLICLLQALDSNNPKLVLPHLIMQVVVIFFLIGFTIAIFVVYSPSPQSKYARRLADVTGSTMGNAMVGLGNVLYGLEEYKQMEKQRKQEKPSAVKPIAKIPAGPANIKAEFEQIWRTYDEGIIVLSAMITFITTAAMEAICLVIILQCYYYLLELHKTAHLVDILPDLVSLDRASYST